MAATRSASSSTSCRTCSPGRRHARLDRRHSSPTTPVRSRLSPRTSGLKCRLVQEKWVPWDDPTNDRVGNILLSRMMGADSRLDPCGLRHRRPRLVEGRAARGRGIRRQAVRDSGRRIEHRLGGLGFANWAFEVAEQEKTLGITSRRSSSAPSPARRTRDDRRVRGSRGADRRAAACARHRRVGHAGTRPPTRSPASPDNTAELIELGRELRDDEIQVLEGWAGDLYGIPVDSTMEAMGSARSSRR